ncbi:hypothetical protein NQ317_017424, partial [Molorchus minor]
MGTAQQYCLRWNNHRSNLLTVFDELLQNEDFTDVTLFCDGGEPIRCHRMVLAACSPYFQHLFTVLPGKHPAVIQKDVKYFEIKAILEYMYRGEVNVAQDQLAALLKSGRIVENHSPSVTTSNSVMQSTVHSSSSVSPPHSTNSMYKNPYSFIPQQISRTKRQDELTYVDRTWITATSPHSAVPNPNDPHATATAAAAMLNSCYEAVSSDMSPLKRKKLSSLLMNRRHANTEDGPRTRAGRFVSAHNELIERTNLLLKGCSYNCYFQEKNLFYSQEAGLPHMKNEPSEDAQSPYTDFTPMNDDEEKSKLAIPSSSPQSFSHEMRGVVNSGIATYVPTQKPEWKRYKQYTRNDIMSAIDAVRNGMSALQAARKYNHEQTVQEREATAVRLASPWNRLTYGGHLSETEEGPINNNSALLDVSTFIQHALDGRGGDERDALTARAAAAATHAAILGHSTSPNNHGRARSPSPSPTMLKYMRHGSMTPSPAPGSDHHNSHSETNGSSERDHEDEEDQVEDLSIGRKESRESRVIMPPMNQVSTIMKKEEMLIDTIKEEARRE